MGLCNQPQSSPNISQLAPKDATSHKQIEQNLRTVLKTEGQVRKVLLLGSGSSGKSTLFRNLKCVYRDGFTETEFEEIVPIIRRNCVSGIIVLLKKSQQLYEMDTKENADCFIDLETTHNTQKELILTIQNIVSFAKETFDGFENDAQVKIYATKNDNDDTIDDFLENKIQKTTDKLYELGSDIKKIWNLSQIQCTFSKRRIYQFSFPDNMNDFFNKLSDIFSWGFQPNNADILKCRIRTTGLVHDWYETKDYSFTITDVGGQRNERRKWIHSFEAVTAVIFVAALNHYAAVLFEDESKNAMIESVELFAEICNSKWFKKTEMILFLNKDDLFREYIINDIALSACFAEKNGAIWKKEYVDDTAYYPKNKKEKAKIYSNVAASVATNKANYKLERVHNDSLSFSQSQDVAAIHSELRVSAEEYKKRCAIYPKASLRMRNKESYANGLYKAVSGEEWFNYIYFDYLNFITEQYISVNIERGSRRIFVHVTTATDGDNVQKVFWDVQNIIIRSNLSRGGLM